MELLGIRGLRVMICLNFYWALPNSYASWQWSIMPRLEIFERGRAAAFLEGGKPVKEVARTLGVTPQAFRKLKTKFEETRDARDRAKIGWPWVTTVRQDKSIINKAETPLKTSGIRSSRKQVRRWRTTQLGLGEPRTLSHIYALINSMQNRCYAVTEADGGPINYWLLVFNSTQMSDM